MAPTGHIELDQLDIDADGRFEILISATEQAGNWLPMTLETDNMLVRQTFHDRRLETPASLTIECLNAAGDNTLDPAQFAEQLAAVPRVSMGGNDSASI